MRGLRSVLFGMHNPIEHGIFVSLAWIKIYHEIPSLKELVCIFLHDIGYIRQDIMDGYQDKHPEMGAKICGQLFGKKYYNLCIAHSRDYAQKCGLQLSRLGYADKYSVILTPKFLQIAMIYLGGEYKNFYRITKNRKLLYSERISLINEDYQDWWNKNGINQNKYIRLR